MVTVTPRRLLAGLGVLLLILIVALTGFAWWVSGQIWDGAFRVDHDPRALDVEVVAFDEDAGTITLSAPGNLDLRSDGLFGLAWEDGYGALGEVLDDAADAVTRNFEILDGGSPPSSTRIDAYAFPADPLVAHEIEFEPVEYPSEDGPLPAWRIPGEGDTWVIAVHGRGADQGEALRLVPLFAESDLPTLVIAYRNHREAPLQPGARYEYGATEWVDLEHAVRYALDAGADDVILVGYSMGGAIVTSFLYQSDLAGAARAALLDSPALNLAASADLQMRDGGVPGWMTRPMRAVTAWRYGIDWDDYDHLAHADDLDLPVLLLHGDADPIVPVETSRELAGLRPDIVTYVEFPGVGHVRGWNQAQAEYLREVEAFFERVLAGATLHESRSAVGPLSSPP